MGKILSLADTISSKGKLGQSNVSSGIKNYCENVKKAPRRRQSQKGSILLRSKRSVLGKSSRGKTDERKEKTHFVKKQKTTQKVGNCEKKAPHPTKERTLLGGKNTLKPDRSGSQKLTTESSQVGGKEWKQDRRGKLAQRKKPGRKDRKGGSKSISASGEKNTRIGKRAQVCHKNENHVGVPKTREKKEPASDVGGQKFQIGQKRTQLVGSVGKTK